jgi:hypothetical protein
MRRRIFTMSGTSPIEATTSVGSVVAGLLEYEWFTIDAALTGIAGGTLDVYLQREVDPDGNGVWADWCHFPQFSAAGAAVEYSAQSGADKTIHVVEQGTTAAAGTPALAANTFIGGHPGNKLRAVFVAGAGATGPAKTQVIKITGWNSD